MISVLLFSFSLISSFWSSDPLVSFPDAHKVMNTKTLNNPFIGRWEGKASTSVETTRIVLEITEVDGTLGATITLMDMGVMGWPAQSAKLIDETLKLNFPTDNSQQLIDLNLSSGSSENRTIEGVWQDTRLEEKARIQLIRASDNPDYRSEALTLQGPTGKLSAELILPNGDGPFPGVVFLHGSGPQPKDASRFAAFAYAREGIASIIFDKRGVGSSEGEWQGADFYDLAADGIAVAVYMSNLKTINSVGFFGHSQGGWIGPLAATLWEDAAFVISSAGPAVSPAREAQWGFINNVKQQGGTKEDIAVVRKVVEEWHEGLRSGIWDAYKADLELARKKGWFESSGLQHLQYPPDPEHLKYYLPFMDYDPIPALLNLKVPLYSILTPDDESIDAMETDAILTDLIRDGKDIRIKLYPGYNHGFKKIGDEDPIRWPGFPPDYFQIQCNFIKKVISP